MMPASPMLVALRAAMVEAQRLADMALPEGTTLAASAQPDLEPISAEDAAAWRQARAADFELARAVYDHALADEARGAVSTAKIAASRAAADRLAPRSLPEASFDGSQIPG